MLMLSNANAMMILMKKFEKDGGGGGGGDQKWFLELLRATPRIYKFFLSF